LTLAPDRVAAPVGRTLDLRRNLVELGLDPDQRNRAGAARSRASFYWSL